MKSFKRHLTALAVSAALMPTAPFRPEKLRFCTGGPPAVKRVLRPPSRK